MSSEKYYWIIHVVGGRHVIHGSYKTPQGAEGRASHLKGGEVHIVETWDDNVHSAEDAYVRGIT